MSSVAVRGARISFGEGEDKKIVLNGLDMDVAPSSIYTLIGASGCGKTTLLSCILGMKALDSGSITVLDRKVNHSKISKVGHRIGYMPQDIALIPELTISETFNFFGNIFLMNGNTLEERSRMIMELLELPSEDRQVQHLSGGQQRRVSLAAAIIHNPLILILDEPTVGLDSLLREKIWKFLIKSTRESNLSIIITTHYISEAQQSDRCGMMRDGVLLVEDSPSNILTKYEATSLDEAFLNLCLLKTEGHLKSIDHHYESTNEDIEESSKNAIGENPGGSISFEKRKKFSFQTVSALCTKEYIRLKRQLAEVIFILLFPALQVFLLAFAIGGLPFGLKVGIVNNEVKNQSMCNFYLGHNASVLNANDECVINYASCHLLNEISDHDVTKVYYDSYGEAFADAKRGKLCGVISIHRNMTETLKRTFESAGSQNFGSLMDISLDQSDLQITTTLQMRLYTAYERFNKKLLQNCNMSEKALSVPMHFDFLHGSWESDFRPTMLPSFVFQILFFSSLAFTSFSIAQNRMDGVWNRTLLAGVKPMELIMTQVIVGTIVQLISVIEIVVTTYFFLSVTIKGSIALLMFFGVIACAVGISLGIAMSVMSTNISAMSLVALGIAQAATVLSGAFWPFEGQPQYLQYFSMVFSVASPSFAVRNIAIRGRGIEDSTVQAGLCVCTSWLIFGFIFAHVAIKKKRFYGK